MRKIRIGYLADGPWSHATFKKLIKDDTIEIKFIVARLNTKDQTLKNFASKYEINYYCNIKINSSEFLAIVFDFKLDLLVSMSFNQIFRQPLLNIPKFSLHSVYDYTMYLLRINGYLTLEFYFRYMVMQKLKKFINIDR